mmetsp:Transcript_24573/g.58101  ORF Transcript_24573/g.58101 Transcript_24573/m.58101 type:complete len:276 (+) Transcript_24573:2852-3679(+)
MEPVDPDQISFVEALDNDFGEFAIHLVVCGPEFLFSSPSAVNWSLLDIVTADLRKLFPVLVEISDTGIRIIFGGMRCIDGGHVVQYRPQDSLAESIVHFSKDQWIDPHRNAVKGPEALLDEVPLVDGHPVVFRRLVLVPPSLAGALTDGGGLLGAVVSVPSLPLDNAYPGDTQMGLHAQEGLVVPVGRPLRNGRGLAAVDDDRQKRADHHQSVRGVELDGFPDAIAGGRRGRAAARLGTGLGAEWLGRPAIGVRGKLRGKSYALPLWLGRIVFGG